MTSTENRSSEIRAASRYLGNEAVEWIGDVELGRRTVSTWRLAAFSSRRSATICIPEMYVVNEDFDSLRRFMQVSQVRIAGYDDALYYLPVLLPDSYVILCRHTATNGFPEPLFHDGEIEFYCQSDGIVDTSIRWCRLGNGTMETRIVTEGDGKFDAIGPEAD